MLKLPALKPREIIKVLRKLGFDDIRQRGSHRFFYRSEDRKSTLVPIHNKDIGKGLLRKILHDIDVSPDEFMKLLKNS